MYRRRLSISLGRKASLFSDTPRDLFDFRRRECSHETLGRSPGDGVNLNQFHLPSCLLNLIQSSNLRRDFRRCRRDPLNVHEQTLNHNRTGDRRRSEIV